MLRQAHFCDGCASILPFVGISPAISSNPKNAFPLFVARWKFGIAGYRFCIEPVWRSPLFFLTPVFWNPAVSWLPPFLNP